jgi:peptidoglycan hydrolase-like protein with peptidoglycan-binding domain
MIQAAHDSGTPNSPITRLVIHATVSPTRLGQARATARYFQSQSSGGSAHFVVDPGEIIQCVPVNTIAWHAPPNRGSLGVELCDSQVGSASRWGDSAHHQMLDRAAALVASLAKTHGVPIVKINAADLRAGRHGICGHVDVSQAWRQTDHQDPGSGFPWATFMAMVQSHANPSAPSPVKPRPKPVIAVPAVRVSGQFDVPTIRRLQAVLGVHVDGQYGTATKAALQRRLGVAADGVIGPATVRALQRHLGVTADGLWGRATTKALQARLNAGRL